MGKGKAGSLAWLAVVLALLVGLPFLGKPFHIDDTVVLTVARQIRHDPWRPFGGQINWSGSDRPVFEETTNPPLLSYYLAPLVAAFGYREVPLHVGMLVFLVVLALATASLCRRFAHGSSWPLVFVMLSPAVVVSGNLMRDVPAMALGAAALALFVAGVDRERWGLVLAGGLVGGLAALTKYSAVMLAPVALVYLGTQRQWRYAWGLAPAAAVLGLWCLENWLTTGQVHLAYLLAHRASPGQAAGRLWPLFGIVGSCLYLLPAVLAALVVERRAGILAGMAAVGAAVPATAALSLGQRVGGQWLLWTSTGAMLLYALLAAGLLAGERRKGRGAPPAWADGVFLASWAVLALAFSVGGVMFQAVRHVVPALVPLALLGGRLLAPVPVRVRWLGALVGLLALAQGGMAFLVGAADYEYADAYRSFARLARVEYQEAGRRTWFSGHWGWQAYAQQAGFAQLPARGAPVRAGDLVIIPDLVAKSELPAGLEERLRLVGEHEVSARLPVRTMDGFVHAGFYATSGDQVPYYFTSDRTLELFAVYRVAPGKEQ